MKVETQILESYWAILKTLNEKLKVNLIERLQMSLKVSKSPDLMRDSFGAWEGDESAEEIISNISTSRKFNRDLSEF